MDTQDEKIGYLTGKIEQLHGDVADIKDSLLTHMEKEDAVIDNIDKRLTTIEHNMNLTVFLWKVVKAAGLTVVFVLAFKFGDIGSLWKSIFH